MNKTTATWLSPLLAIGMAALLGSGCQTYQQQNTIAPYWQNSDLANAEKEATKKANDKNESKDAIVWRLEQATVLRAAGKLDESNKAFDQAQASIDKYAETAKTKLAHEAAALFSNQANLPYEGRSYDGIMLNTYKALNYLQLNQPDKARVELIRAYQRQQDAVQDNKRRIEKTQEELNQADRKNKAQGNSSRDNPDAVDKDTVVRAQRDDKFKSQMNEKVYGDLARLKVYSDYVNPFTVFMDGLYFMATSRGGSDLERARKSFERVLAYTGGNPAVKAELDTIESVYQGGEIAPATYVIFETGRAPIRDQIRIDIPIIVMNVSYVGASFPKLMPQGDYVTGLQVSGGGVSQRTVTVASLDSVIGHDFKNELPVVITKTLASTIAKAAASYAINHAADQADALAGLVARLATAAFQASVNIADTRTWTTLPKEFQYCRIPTPADRKIELQAVSGGQRTTVTVADGTVNVVYVKCIGASGPLMISQMKLK